MVTPPRRPPGDRGHHPDGRKRDPSLIGVVAHVDEKRPRECLGELVGELVEEDEREDLERAVPREKTEKGLPHGVSKGLRRLDLHFGLGSEPGQEHHGQVDEPEKRVDRGPAPTPGERDGDASGHQHRGAVEREPRSRCRTLLILPQHVDGVGVIGDVLRRRSESDRDGDGPDDPDRIRMAADAREREAQHRERELHDGHPAAAASPERGDVAIHERRPQDLERPRHLREGEQAHDADVDSDGAHPVGDRVPDEPQGKSRGEREQGDRGRAPGAHGPREVFERSAAHLSSSPGRTLRRPRAPRASAPRSTKAPLPGSPPRARAPFCPGWPAEPSSVRRSTTEAKIESHLLPRRVPDFGAGDGARFTERHGIGDREDLPVE